MIGNLFLKFKTCPFNDNTFKLNDSKYHECCVIIGLHGEEQLEKEMWDKSQDLVVTSKCIDIKENEYVYDLEYVFEEIKICEGEDDTDVEYDFRTPVKEEL